ncbi:hypothetical protein L6452_17152 [Arctium lappa]|uniref:Uncharacterized protein n=1 Tax=Arctium lappa TaxID=4217 RepID=A0ACB9C2Q8_ARCLA|nr:hypothetical protein L6452_17152 [Arctium lappa]
MAGLMFVDDHNELAMLQKPKQAEGFHQIVDFLKSSHIAYALTVNPTIYVEHLRQFWTNVSIQNDEGTQVIHSRVCDKPITITEDCIHTHLRLDDASGITSLSKEDLYQSISRMGYEGPTEPTSPLMEHFPSENIERETTGVSPNPKKVLYKEKDEHVGRKAHTTVSAQGVEQDSVNISKTFPTATLDEQSSKGPRCQETKGVEGASARQKASTKRSKDPSKVVNTPKEGEDRYNYDELMDTLGTISLEVHNQNLEIQEMKKVITSQQMKITKLKKMVLRLVQKKKKKQYVLKRRGDVNDAFKKGESQVEGEKQSPVGMESHCEGELNSEAEKKQATEKAKEVETSSAAVTTPEVVTTAVETEKVAAETGMSAEEIEIADSCEGKD